MVKNYVNMLTVQHNPIFKKVSEVENLIKDIELSVSIIEKIKSSRALTVWFEEVFSNVLNRCSGKAANILRTEYYNKIFEGNNEPFENVLDGLGYQIIREVTEKKVTVKLQANKAKDIPLNKYIVLQQFHDLIISQGMTKKGILQPLSFEVANKVLEFEYEINELFITILDQLIYRIQSDIIAEANGNGTE